MVEGRDDRLDRQAQRPAHYRHEKLKQPEMERQPEDSPLVFGKARRAGRKRNGKRVERKGKGVARVYGKVVTNSGHVQLGQFIRDTVEANAQIKTDVWTGYKPLAKEFVNLVQVPSGKKGENFPDLHRVIMGFKGWLRGMHHHAELLQSYVDEFTYRFNRHTMKVGIFDNLLLRMLKGKPCTYEMIIA